MDKVSGILCHSNLSAKGLQNFAKKSQVIIIRIVAIVKSLGCQEQHMKASEKYIMHFSLSTLDKAVFTLDLTKVIEKQRNDIEHIQE